MERLAYWLCSGLVSLGNSGASTASTFEHDDEPGIAHQVPVVETMCESRIRYPLQVDDWRAVGEHLFEEREYGMSVRYAHGRDRDRWIDVYFYPAGSLSAAGFAEAAQQEAELIGEAHALAGYEDSDIGPLRDFRFPASRSATSATSATTASGDPARGVVEGVALDLSYAVDGTEYSSAMTLLLERQYFVKARFSIERTTLSRDEAREQLMAFTAHLQPRVAILHGAATAPVRASARAGLREIRLEYAAEARIPASRPVAEEVDAG